MNTHARRSREGPREKEPKRNTTGPPPPAGVRSRPPLPATRVSEPTLKFSSRTATAPKAVKHVMAKFSDKSSISKLHGLMISSGLLNSNSTAQLIASYARVGCIKSARKMLDKSPKRGVNAWNAMIVAYSRAGFPLEVIGVYEQMSSEGVKPDSATFTMAIKACTVMVELELGEKIWKRAVEFGYRNDVFVGTSVLNFLCKCGKMDEAVEVFEKMQKRDMFCWTAIIMGFVQSGRVMEALETYKGMKKAGMEGDVIVILGLIQALANLGDVKLSCSVHGYIIRNDLPLDVVLQTSLVDMYSKIGKMKTASRVFWLMPEKNVVSWSAIISGFSQNGCVADALELLTEMQKSGFEANLVSLVSALLACSQIGRSKLGKSVHGYALRRRHISEDERLSTALIDMYAKCGSISYARALFDSLNHRDLVCCNAMISSYGIHGNGEEALSIFNQMIVSDLKPDHATFASLLSALGHSGLVKEGKHWFDVMVKDYKIEPSEKHYAALVDLLARAGQVDEAWRLIDSSMAGLPVWVALLSGCLNHNKFSVGKVAAKKILEVGPDDSGILTLVANFYAANRMWGEVAEIRKLMKERGMARVPGHSVAEVDGKLHSFVMEDKSHPQYEQIQEVLEKLGKEMIVLGSSPHTEFIQTTSERTEYSDSKSIRHSQLC